MALDMRPLHSSFGVEIAGIDVRRIDEAVFREVARALDDHSVLLFPRQSLTDDEQIAFSERFGPLETTIRTIASQARDLPEISNLSNVDTEDRLIPRGDKRNLFNAGNQMWHSDSSFKRVPAMASLLSAREVPPEGGETQFASMRVGYEGLPEAMKQRLEGKVAIHSFVYSRGLVGDELLPPDHAAQVPPVPAGPRAGQPVERAESVLRRLPRLRDRRHADRGGARAAARATRRGDPSGAHLHASLGAG